MKVYSILYMLCYTNIMSLDFFQNGVTEFDERFFNTQKNRQHLELQIIPQLTKYSSSHYPSKRTKIS